MVGKGDYMSNESELTEYALIRATNEIYDMKLIWKLLNTKEPFIFWYEALIQKAWKQECEKGEV